MMGYKEGNKRERERERERMRGKTNKKREGGVREEREGGRRGLEREQVCKIWMTYRIRTDKYRKTSQRWRHVIELKPLIDKLITSQWSLREIRLQMNKVTLLWIPLYEYEWELITWAGANNKTHWFVRHFLSLNIVYCSSMLQLVACFCFRMQHNVLLVYR